jgi:hypothetical protein
MAGRSARSEPKGSPESEDSSMVDGVQAPASAWLLGVIIPFIQAEISRLKHRTISLLASPPPAVRRSHFPLPWPRDVYLSFPQPALANVRLCPDRGPDFTPTPARGEQRGVILLARAATSEQRGLLASSGAEIGRNFLWERRRVRQGCGRGVPSVMMFVLPGFVARCEVPEASPCLGSHTAFPFRRVRRQGE